ncbi:MAG TPA: kynureninase [Rhodobacteraceae bacterium]|nr:kynureninase [Amylibacter sp.]MDG1235423.1 kynureninase [Amylibacter sp.]HAD28568.1 kynureninase [Paracoccaceae bacterium]|tara:strand:- start:527 stop:1711 length:1185 start_codon:yes stop_codon:yes gene_type:complete
MTQFPKKNLFYIPDGMIYLDGNSLGPIPKAAPAAIQNMLTGEWGEMLIRGWNNAGWMAQPSNLGNQIAPIIGAEPDSVAVGDTLSIKVFQALAAALNLNPDRCKILSDNGNFPTDLYMAEGLIRTIGKNHQLVTVDPEEVIDQIDADTAVVMLTQVDYRTGRLHDTKAITNAAHAAGAVMIWDLAHSAGAMPIDLAGAELAVGCTYKYLNAGPGAPAFIYVRPDLANKIQPALSGWLGHDAPFAFEQNYRPGKAIERMRVGTPPVIQMASLQVALDIWKNVNLTELRATSVHLSERFIAGIEANCPDLTLASPRDPNARGSQVSFAFEDGYAAMQAIIDRNVIGDFRAPNIMRFGFTPLYLDETDIDAAVEIIAEVMTSKSYNIAKYQTRKAVT